MGGEFSLGCVLPGALTAFFDSGSDVDILLKVTWTEVEVSNVTQCV